MTGYFFGTIVATGVIIQQAMHFLNVEEFPSLGSFRYNYHGMGRSIDEQERAEGLSGFDGVKVAFHQAGVAFDVSWT